MNDIFTQFTFVKLQKHRGIDVLYSVEVHNEIKKSEESNTKLYRHV